MVPVVVQLLASLSVSVNIPAHKPVTAEVEAPPGAQLYVYAPMPPVAVAVTDPVHTELHTKLNPVIDDIANNGGSVIVVM